MKKRILSVVLVICILFTCFGAGCSKQSDNYEENTTTEKSTTKVTEKVTESTTESTTETTESTTKEGTTDGGKGKETTTKKNNTSQGSFTSSSSAKDIAKEFYKDAAFIGDSISLGLRNRSAQTGRISTATFLTRGSFGSGHAVRQTMLLIYQGKEMTPEAAVKACGAKKVETLVNRIREKSPNVKVYIQSMTPIVIGSEAGKLNNTSIDEYNVKLKAMAARKGATYIDVASKLKDSNNGLRVGYSSDNYVHLSSSGLDVWLSVLEEFAKSQVPVTTTKPTTTKPTTTKPTTTKPTTTKPETTTESETTTAAESETTTNQDTTTTQGASENSQ